MTANVAPGPATSSSGAPSGAVPADGRPSRRLLVWRWAARGVALIAVAILVMVTALTIGMRANDAAIEEHLGTATATVLSLSPLRTGIEFVDVTGATIRPEGGVLYPGLLSLGQQFVVEYDIANPQIARVAGRAASVGTVLIGFTAVLTVVVAVPLIWWCQRRSRLPVLGLHPGPGHSGSGAPLADAARAEGDTAHPASERPVSAPPAG